jgi:PAS domain-containing protein
MRLRFVLEALSGPLKETRFVLTRQETIIGRGEDCHLRLQDDEVSRRHCSIRVRRGQVVLSDLGSANGIQVNGRFVDKIGLNSGDVIRVGKTELRLGSEEEEAGDADKTRFYNTEANPSWVERLRGLGWSTKILLIMLAAALFSHALVAWPLLSEQRKMASQEALRKAEALVTALAALNQEALRIGDEMLLDVERIAQHEGVVEAYVYDRAGRILAPVSRFLQTPADPAARAAILATDRMMQETREGVYDLSEPIRIYDVQTGKFVKIGTARIIFSLHSITSLEEGVQRNALISLIVLLLVAAVVAWAIGLVTRRPLALLRDDLESALKGDKDRVVEHFGLAGLDRLAGSINRALIKMSALSSCGAREGGGVFADMQRERDKPIGSGADPWEAFATMLPAVISDGVMVADADNVIVLMNPAFCRIMNVGHEARGRHFFEAFPDQAVLAGVMKLIQAAIASPENTADNPVSSSQGQALQAHVTVKMIPGRDEFQWVIVVLNATPYVQGA